MEKALLEERELGHEAGIAEGRELGTWEMIQRLVNDGLLSVENAALKLNVDAATFVARMQKTASDA